MPIQNGLFTSEAVSSGHPDKLCDKISDAVLDAFLRRDPRSRVACETFAAHGKVLVAGEFRTADPHDFAEVERSVPELVRETLKRIGYTSAAIDIDPDECEIEVRFNRQSDEIAAGVDQPGILGAGDQGLMFGYATTETPSFMPLAWSLANELIAKGESLRRAGGCPLRPDAKSQVTVQYVDGQPIGIDTVVLSWQHNQDVAVEDIRQYLTQSVIDAVIPLHLRTPHFKTFINPAGAWTVGGPRGDTGLTGRKIIADTYGGACPHGGGAFSGKDPSKVDRSGAYASRYVARHIVASGIATRCTVQLSYGIGRAEPISINVDLHGTSRIEEKWVTAAVAEVFDLTPAGIIAELNLLRPIYSQTSTLGHFGNQRDPAFCKWETNPHTAALLTAVEAKSGVRLAD